MLSAKNFILLFISIIVVRSGFSQTTDTTRWRTLAANPSLNKVSESWKKHWGYNRRVEWATAVTVPVFYLDTAYGGLKFYEKGGGNESRTLHFLNPAGKAYTIRSINKSRKDVIPPGFEGTFVETIINDQLSSSHPYGAFIIPYMQEQAGLLHSKPFLVYLPTQNRLDSFNKRFAEDVYMVEQRPDGDWSESRNLGYIKDFVSSEKVLDKLQEEKKYEPDQHAFIKAKIFDMLIGDWDRHEGNWRWGKIEIADKKWYKPIGRDRDQAFYTHNGVWIDKFLPMSGLSYMQHFDYKAGDPVQLFEESWNFDRFYSNEMTLEDWVNAAKELQSALTDTVIAQSVRGLPPEIFPVSGAELIDKLKSRRSQLVELATAYYTFLAKQVDIVGSSEKEYFEVSSASNGEMTVAAYVINKKGMKKEPVYYKRTFKPGETDEVRLYGIGDEDVYKIDYHSPIVLRVIGGHGKDSIVHSGDRIHIYDNRDNVFKTGATKFHLSSDSAIHRFRLENFHPNSKGFSPVINYNYEDRFYAGLSYTAKTHRWNKDPFASKHTIGVNYSISQHAISAAYGGLFPRVFGKLDFFVDLGYDAVRWYNFYGLGNETKYDIKKIGYHRMVTHEWLGDIGIRGTSGKSTLEIAAFYQRVNIKRDAGSYVAQTFGTDYEKELKSNGYIGGWFKYHFISVNDKIVPTKGFVFSARMLFSNRSMDQPFAHYAAKAQAFLPLGKKFSLSVKLGGATVGGSNAVLNTAQPYQHAMIGGPESLRGYRMERFWGKSSFYNNNELRFITNIRSYLLNAKIGLLGFFDDGRVWMPGEISNTLHTSYGGGILFAPFNQLSVTVTYGISDELKILQFRINTLL